MPRALTQQTLVIFGATGGIGSALTRDLCAADAQVYAAARGGDRLQALADETGARAVTADVTDPEQVAAVLDRAIADTGQLDGVVLAVGSILLRPAHRLKDADFEDTLSINLGAAFNVVRATTQRMMRAGGGSIVLFSTAAAQLGLPNHEAIAAAKLGIEGLARATAASYAARGIRVNCIAPGLVRTPLSERITGHPASLEASRKMHALGRIGEPEDIAHAARFLLESTWVTGQTLVVDGGLSGVRA